MGARTPLAVAGGALLVGGWAIAVREPVPQAELDLTRAITDVPDAWYPAVWPVMQLGSLGGGLAVAAGTAALAARRRTDSRLPAALFLAPPIAWLGAKAVKAVVRRGRPARHLPGFVPRESAPGLGFVSGHAAVAFALASASWGFVPPPVRPATLTTATVVGVSRVYVGVHLPADVVGGAGLGILAGLASASLTRTCSAAWQRSRSPGRGRPT